MNNFEFSRATDVADAVRQIAADPGATFVAGGTNLIDLIKEGVTKPSRLIVITRLELNRIEDTRLGLNPFRLNNSGSLAMFAAILRASSWLSNLARANALADKQE